MTVLSDNQLAKIAAMCGIPPERINPASIDLSLGHEIEVATWQTNSLSELRKLRDYQNLGPHASATQLEQAKKYADTLRNLCQPNKTIYDLRNFRDGFWLLPFEGALLHTEHVIEIPEDKSGLLLLKSSRGREFWQHAFSGWFDPGFKGQGVLEVYAPVIPIHLEFQKLAAQLVLFDTYPVAVPYGDPKRKSHYQGQRGARGSAHL